MALAESRKSDETALPQQGVDMPETVPSVAGPPGAELEYAGFWRSKEYTGFTLQGLRDGGMTVGPASDQMVAELKEIGVTMTNEWLEAAGDEGKAIVDAFKAMQ